MYVKPAPRHVFQIKMIIVPCLMIGIIMSNNKAIQKFTGILEEAIEVGADPITLEYVSERMEVCYMFGNIGLGFVLIDQELESAVVGYIVRSAKLDKRARGELVMKLHGKQRTIFVRRYDHFGESAFEIKLKGKRVADI